RRIRKGSSTSSPSRTRPRLRSCSRRRGRGPGSASGRSQTASMRPCSPASSAAADTPGHPAPRSPCRSRRPDPRSSPRRSDSSPPSRADRSGESRVMDGILVVAKPVGPTSHDIVGLVRRLAATKRVGHGGTLDPFASGVLPVFLGKATRLVEYHLGDRKRYRATVCFGASSTTDDLEGALTPATGPPPTRVAVEAALAGFRGPIEQRPPAYSAIKVAGRRAYALARA